MHFGICQSKYENEINLIEQVSSYLEEEGIYIRGFDLVNITTRGISFAIIHGNGFMETKLTWSFLERILPEDLLEKLKDLI